MSFEAVSRLASCVVLLLVFANATGGRVRRALTSRPVSCSSDDMTYFRLFQRPIDNGSLPFNFAELSSGNVVGTAPESSRIQYLRSYLPDAASLVAYYDNSTRRYCDRAFSNQLQKWILDGDNFVKSQGYPFDRNCSDPSACHRPSVGKYIRYISMMEFHRFTGKPNQSFADIVFPYGWNWAANISSCVAAEKKDGQESVTTATPSWNCAFQPFSAKDQSLSRSLGNISLEITKEALWQHRSTPKLKNHVVQVMLFGKVLNILTRPSKAVVDFLLEHLKTIRLKAVENATALTIGNGSPSRNTSLTVTPKGRRPTVSMHVRQGDSCNYMLNKAVDKMTTYLENGTIGRRPCFSVDVYMEKLYELQKLYGVDKVFLATDSEEMIQRVRKEHGFQWTFLNITRIPFDRSHGMMDFRRDSRELITFSAVADLHLLRRGDIFLGGFASHFSKLAYYAMAGYNMRIPPFISVDYPLSCDTTDKCDDASITRRFKDIEDMIFHAVECQRLPQEDKVGWGPRSHEDPCGIYADV